MLATWQSIWQSILAHPEWTIPLVTALVTWAHVWMALKMLFYPLKFWGIRLPFLPKSWQNAGFLGVGWQGIVPRKAGKISGVIVDQTLSKLGSLDEFFEAMDPVEMADFITKAVDEHLEDLIDEIMMERSPTLWSNLPFAIKRRIYAHVHGELPKVMRDLVLDLTQNVTDLVDMRQMIVHKMEHDRALMVRMFLKVGQKEINFIWHVSFWIGLVFGVVQMFVFVLVPEHWTVPFFAAIWGFLTNWIAIFMVFNPVEPRFVPYLKVFSCQNGFGLVRPQVAYYRWQGGFMKRQAEVSEVFAEIVVRDLVTLENIMREMMYGKYADRTRVLLKRHLYEVLDSPVVETSLRLGLGRHEFGQLKNAIIDKSIEATMQPISDPKLNVSRADKIFGLFRDRILALSPDEFQNLLRPAFREDEMTLVILGGVTGFLAGWLHLILVFY